MKIKSCNMFIENADAIVITTNGFVKKNGEAVMGRGTARQASRLWYGIAKVLGEKINKKGNKVFLLTHELENGIRYFKLPRKDGPLLMPVPWHVVTFPVKKIWSDPADLTLIKESCIQLLDLIKEKGWKRVLLPRPGCGNGGLSWESNVRPLLKKTIGKDDHIVIVWNEEKEISDATQED